MLQAPPSPPLLGISLALIPDWAQWLLSLVYGGDSLAPKIEVAGAFRRAIKRADGVWLEFYKFEPLEDISTSGGVRVIDVLAELLNRLSLASLELGFFKLRLGGQTLKVLRVGYMDRGRVRGGQAPPTNAVLQA
ncbi:hypothetical protein [Vulcanisaeta souniana]|uniref:hypothetical protein n=1 Tax=Vulcanisaeta souniana TaxID=164452 RepID=UPI0006D25F6E|nr:hypothetical protein [Vulcanisaeta souniana]